MDSKKHIPALRDEPTDGDQLAESEATAIANDRLEKEAAEGKHRRTERTLNATTNIAIGALWLGAVTLAVIAIVWLWHLLAPECRHWLTREQFHNLQSILLSGVVSSAATALVGPFVRR